MSRVYLCCGKVVKWTDRHLVSWSLFCDAATSVAGGYVLSLSGGCSEEKFSLAIGYTCRSKYVFDRINGGMSLSTGSGFVPGKESRI